MAEIYSFSSRNRINREHVHVESLIARDELELWLDDHNRRLGVSVSEERRQELLSRLRDGRARDLRNAVKLSPHEQQFLQTFRMLDEEERLLAIKIVEGGLAESGDAA